MKEIGRIVEIKDDTALVLMEEKEKCKSCNLCKKIIPRQLLIEAENIVKAEVGDLVSIEVDEDDLFKISIYIYGFPLLGFLIGVVFSYFLKDLLFKVITFVLPFLTFWIIGFKKGRTYGEKTKPKIISKIQRGL